MTTLRRYQREVTHALQERGGALYLFAALIGTVAVAVAIYRVVEELRERKSPGVLEVVVAFCLFCTFVCKAPYLWNKILARSVLLIWGALWFGIAVASLVALLRAKR